MLIKNNINEVKCNRKLRLMTKETVPNKNGKVPQWQSEKMRMLISDRWQEIQEIVKARESDRQQYNRHYRR